MADDLDVLERWDELADRAALVRRLLARVDGTVVVALLIALEVRVAAEDERAVLGLATVEVAVRRGQAHLRHRGLNLSDEALVHALEERDPESDRLGDAAGVEACGQHDVLGLVHIARFGEHLAAAAVHLFQCDHVLARDVIHAQTARGAVIGQRRHHGVRVAVHLAVERLLDVIRKDRTDLARLVAVHDAGGHVRLEILCELDLQALHL